MKEAQQEALTIAASKEVFPEAPELNLLRFLVARKWNVARATAMYEARVDW